MRLSRYFLPILRETPKEAEIVSHRLMLRAGMMRQEAAGIYAFLPLGLRVLRKIERIVREEQDRSGAIEPLESAAREVAAFRHAALLALQGMDHELSTDALHRLMDEPSLETRYGSFCAIRRRADGSSRR